MKEATVFIKGMVCGRCISTVENVFQKLGMETGSVKLGEATVSTAGTKYDEIHAALKPWGFSLLNAEKLTLINRVKDLVDSVYSGDFEFPVNFSFPQYAAMKLGKSYEELNRSFSGNEGLSIEYYSINCRIEKTRELLANTGLSLSEIAFRLGYSSVPHLSKQFKQKTGLNPSDIRTMK